MRRTRRWGFAPSWLRRYGWPPSQPPRPWFVIGRVTLWDAIERQAHPRHLYDTVEAVQYGQDRGRIVFGPKALAASRARIDELWIYDAKALRPFAPELQKTLSARWTDVPVSIGEPDYTAQEWDSKESSDALCQQFGLFRGGGGPVPPGDLSAMVAPEKAFEDIAVPLGLRAAGAPGVSMV